jgi:hypothetical protein
VRELFPVFLDEFAKTSWYDGGWSDKMAGKLKKLTQGQAEESVRLYESGMSIQEVADYFSVSRQGMWDLLRRRTKMRSNLKYGSENGFHRGTRADARAHDLVEKAILRGRMIRGSLCEACGKDPGKFSDGRSAIQAHHDDYNKPLEVRWMCQPCHHEWHKNNRAKPLEVRQEVSRVDVIAGGFP